MHRLFQLTAPQGGWRTESNSMITQILFQLTAPQGGWPVRFLIDSNNGYFNSQPHKGADCRRLRNQRSSLVFQLTAPQGGWPYSRLQDPAFLYFNSQPHKGADPWSNESIKTKVISTHSPTRGLTSYMVKAFIIYGISTHSPTRGLTECRTAPLDWFWHFNSQPHKGADSNFKQENLSKIV